MKLCKHDPVQLGVAVHRVLDEAKGISIKRQESGFTVELQTAEHGVIQAEVMYDIANQMQDLYGLDALAEMIEGMLDAPLDGKE